MWVGGRVCVCAWMGYRSECVWAGGRVCGCVCIHVSISVHTRKCLPIHIYALHKCPCTFICACTCMCALECMTVVE